jgi:hypothetical protein
VRVDALTLPAGIIAGGCLIILAGRRAGGRPARSVAALSGLYLLGFGAGFAFFVAVRGAWSGKPVTDVLLGLRDLLGDRVAPAAAVAAPAPQGLLPAIWEVLRDLGQEVQFLHLATCALAIAAICRTRRISPGGLFLAALTLVYLAVLVLVRMRAGYVASRYFLPLVPGVVCLGAYGFLAAARIFHGTPPHVQGGRAVRREVALAVLLVLGSLACSVPSLLKRMTVDDDHGVMEAGRWVTRSLKEGETLHDPYFFPSYISGLRGPSLVGPVPAPGTPRHLVIAKDGDLDRLPDLEKLILLGKAAAVAAFPRVKGGEKLEVKVYEIRP